MSHTLYKPVHGTVDLYPYAVHAYCYSVGVTEPAGTLIT
eukprot:SAG11_NODE_1302_length_5254_cov_4.749758_1_plen_38_part_10